MVKRLQLILGSLFFLLVFINAGLTLYPIFKSLPTMGDWGWSAKLTGQRLVIARVDETGPAAALREGDELVALNGQPIDNVTQVTQFIRQLKAGDSYSIQVRRAGTDYTFTFNIEPLPLLPLWLTAILVLPTIFLVTGFAVFLLKPYDQRALLLGLMFGMFTGALAGALPFAEHSPWVIGLMVAARIISTFFYPVFAHFFLIFPEPSPLLRRFPRLQYFLYLPQVLIILPFAAIFDILLAYDLKQALAFVARFGIWQGLASTIGIAYICAGFGLLYFNYQQANLAAKRKMRVVLAGSTVGFLPALLLTVLGTLQVLGGIKLNNTLLLWLAVGMLFAFPLFPLSFAYAILRHKVIPVRLIIRRGVRYIFVAQGSMVLEMLAVFVAITLLLNYFFTYLRPSSGLVIGIVSGVVSVTVWNLTSFLHRRVIAPVIDRRFFRQAYDAQHVLAELGNALRLTTDLSEITSLVGSQIQDALQTANVTIFLRDEATGDYLSIHSTEYVEDSGTTISSPKRELRLPRDGVIIRQLREAAQPLTVDYYDARPWTQILLADTAGNQARQHESETLERIQSALLLPIATKDQLLGVVSLGPRLGDLPYSRENKQMLMAVVWQMAFAIENTKLVRARIKEERLKRELETATEVQRRLFPARPPEIDGLELAGVCYPARGVGGDYYDFLSLDNGQIGLAVADVAGKGISAALVMSVVQASLRSQAQSGNCCLTDLVATMNRLLYTSTGSNSYATFFYGQFDCRTRELTYVNAGHNPPLLVRRSQLLETALPLTKTTRTHGGAKTAAVAEPEPAGGVIQPLLTGGLVIGLFEDCAYEQETITLQSGDVLIAYTDGVTEALNPAGEEYGEERLENLVTEAAHLSAEALVETIVESAREWRREAPQHDDLTLIVLKVK